jgi:hypothetical protein
LQPGRAIATRRLTQIRPAFPFPEVDEVLLAHQVPEFVELAELAKHWSPQVIGIGRVDVDGRFQRDECKLRVAEVRGNGTQIVQLGRQQVAGLRKNPAQQFAPLRTNR